MSLFSALSTSLSGLQSVTTQMQLVANNIANAGQEGFTRKTANLGSVSLGDEGGGTQIVGFSRATDEALSATLNIASSDAGLRSTQDKYLQQVQTILGTNSGNNPPLATAMTNLASAWSQLAAAPESGVQQKQVIQASTNLATQVRSTAAAIEALDRQSSAELTSSLNDLNSYLTNISDLNKKISQALSANQSPGAMQDQRDQLVQKVATLTNVTVLQRPQGQIALYTHSGYMLVDGQNQNFSYNGSTITSTLDPTHSLNSVLTGGKLEALVNFRTPTSPVSTDPATSVIQKLQSQMDTIVGALTASMAGPPETFAHAYANADTATGEASTIFIGSDRTDFAVNPALLNGTETIKIASAQVVADAFNESSRAFTTYQTASANVASGSMTLQAAYSGTFGNGVTMSLSAGTTAGTYKATISVAGQAYQEVYDNVAGTGAAFWSNLASAINSRPSHYATATAGTGSVAPTLGASYTLSGGSGGSMNYAATATIAGNMTFTALGTGAAGNNLRVTISDGTAAGTKKATITDGTTTETYDNVAGAGATFWNNLAAAVNGAPSDLVLATTLGGTGAATNTTYTLDSGATPISAAGLSVSGVSYTTLVTSIVSGFQQSASTVAQLSDTATQQQAYLQQRLTNETGVNTDTEIVSLTMLQNAYAASARVMSIIQQMFSTLENIT